MSLRLYSRPLFFGQVTVADGNKVLFTVPDGHTYVLRDLDGFGVTAGANVLYLRTGVGSFGCIPVTGPNLPYTFRGRQVFEAGESFAVSVSASTVFLRCCGYDFEG